MNRLAAIARRTLVLGVALAAFVYAGDYAALRLRAAYPRFGSAYDSVTMERLYAIPLKNGRTEYELDARQPEVTVSCVRTLFPHQGYPPCWYVRHNSQKPIPMMIMIPVTLWSAHLFGTIEGSVRNPTSHQHSRIRLNF